MSKGSARRPENATKIAANWPFKKRKTKWNRSQEKPRQRKP
jgi:hypothetical protein